MAEQVAAVMPAQPAEAEEPVDGAAE